jgi:hypothetical protein
MLAVAGMKSEREKVRERPKDRTKEGRREKNAAAAGKGQ